MNSQPHPAKPHTDPHDGERDEELRDLLQRANKHRVESERLARNGDPRQAEVHANIARRHDQSARALNARESIN